jgi:outer membrane protein assembly factor BamB
LRNGCDSGIEGLSLGRKGLRLPNHGLGQLAGYGGSPQEFHRAGLKLFCYGEECSDLTALRIANGEKVWFSPPIVCAPTAKPGCSPAQSQAVTAIPGVVFSGSLDGHLRAYSSEEGKIIWDVDTVREYQTVNGVRANGGSLNGPGAVVAGGMVFVNSGYARLGSTPGNVLSAFSVDGK